MGVPEWFAGISEGASALQAALSDPDQALTFVKDAVDMADLILPGDGLTVPIGPFEIEIESVEGEKDWLEPNSPGSNWYSDRTGDPPSPFDCERWPNSPFCQSVLDTVKEGWFGIGVSISISENEICINPTFTIAFFTMPMGNFCYRRTPEEEPEPEPPTFNDQDGPLCTGCLPPTRKPALWGLYDYSRSYWVVESVPVFDRMTNTCSMTPPQQQGIDHVGSGTFGGVCPPARSLPLRRIIQGDFDLKDPENQVRYQYWVNDFPFRRFSNCTAIVFSKFQNVVRDPERKYGVRVIDTRTSSGGHDQIDSYTQYFWKASDDLADRVAAIRVNSEYSTRLRPIPREITGTYWNGFRNVPYNCGTSNKYWTDVVKRVVAPAVVETGDRRRPEPPPLDRRPEDMGCCPETQDQLQWLVKKLGLNRLPVAATESITADEEKTIRLDSLVELVHHGAKSTLEVLGEWPVKIEIRTDEGEESGEIKLPNVAETLAELFGLEFGTSRDSDAAYAAAIAGLGVSSSILSTLISTLDRVEALSEFVGGRVKAVTREYELPFDPFADPGTTSQEKLFTRTLVKTEGWENDDKLVLATLVSEIREQIKLLEAVFVERGHPEQLMGRLQKLADLAKGVVSASEMPEEDKSWRQTVTELETQVNTYLEANGMQKVKLNIKGQMTDTPKEDPKP